MPLATDCYSTGWTALCVSERETLSCAQVDEAAELLHHAEGLLANRKLELVRAAFDQAQAAGADADRCSAGRWHAAMLDGNFEAAWRESDAIRARGAPDPHRFWNGESLRGVKVIVRCLHGYGDAVQMLRYAPRLAQIASRVVFEVPPQLLPLATLFCGVEEAISWGELAPLKPSMWDVQVEAMELPYIFRTHVAELPIATRYLDVPENFAQATAEKMGETTRPRVGLVWASGEWNPERSVPLELLEPLLQSEAAEFWSLQGESAAANARGLMEAGAMRDATAVCGDGLVALAATIENLDLVITVDTLAAHLAGALGKPAWVLLQYAADWRWMHAREDSPWYPTLRIFRQPAPNDWRSAIGAMHKALELWDDPLYPVSRRVDR